MVALKLTKLFHARSLVQKNFIPPQVKTFEVWQTLKIWREIALHTTLNEAREPRNPIFWKNRIYQWL
ncbi:MAG: hypothetical protein DRR19_10495 [Candidatus Parabeggiatoa sp. nov. 1]|nr:MAG: hypothetical protein DRR19_10495 [Gammaproteobacteria bacterium]